jgi:hypothetical protein
MHDVEASDRGKRVRAEKRNVHVNIREFENKMRKKKTELDLLI